MNRPRSCLVSAFSPVLLLLAAMLLVNTPARAQGQWADAASAIAPPTAPPERTLYAQNQPLPAPASPSPNAPAASPPLPATAPNPPAPNLDTGPKTPSPPSAVPPPDCQTPPVQYAPAQGNLKLRVTLDPTRWQPVGGMVKFTIESDDLSLDTLKIVACFRWREGDEKVEQPANWRRSQSLQVLSTESRSKITFGAIVPKDLKPGWSPVSMADFRIMANSSATWKQLDIVFPVGITLHYSAFLVTLIVIGVFWITLLRIGSARGIQGNPILRIIANRYCYASLSQLQIILWTFVMAAGATYVMVLSGGLIDIPTQALMLLGISGLAILGAQLPGATASTTPAPGASAAAPAAPAPPTPGIVTSLSVVGPINDTSVVLFWQPSSGGAPPASYIVQQSTTAPPTWAPLGAGTADPFFAVVGLTPGMAYSYRVIAVDASGRSGTASQPVDVPTPAAPLGPPPGQPTNLTPIQPLGETTITLTWTAPAPAPGNTLYLVQYRPTGAAAWATASEPVNGLRYTLGGLLPATTYDFQVAAVGNGAIGPWSAPAVASTLKRVPKWADLVIWDGINEIDVTRVQMLLFTVIAAGFVLLKIYNDNTIPDIPPGILLLIGLSNGVYLTAKFIPPQR